MLSWGGQFGQISQVTGGSKASFAANAYVDNQTSRSSDSVNLWPVINWDAIRFVLIQGSAQASAQIGGNSSAASSGLSMQFSENVIVQLVHAQAEEHHDINIPSDAKSASWIFTVARAASGFIIYLGLPSDNVALGAAASSQPILNFTASASANQTGCRASVTGNIDIRTVEMALPENEWPPGLTLPAGPGGNSGSDGSASSNLGTLALLGGVMLLNREKKRGK